MAGRAWSEDEVETLKTLWADARVQYPDTTSASRAAAEHMPGRSFHAVYNKVKVLLDAGDLEPVVSMDMDPEAARDVIERETEINQLRSELTDLGRKYRDTLDALSEQADLLALTSERLDALPAIKPPAPPKVSKFKEDPQSDILNISDWHIGETVSGIEMRGINEYNFEVMKARWQYLIDTVRSVRVNHHAVIPVETLNVNFLGDMIGGVLHDKPEYSEGHVLDRLLIGGAVIAQGLRELAATYPKIITRWVPGNESRITVKKQYRGRYNNWDIYLAHIVRQYLRDQENIAFEIPESFFTEAHIEGWTHLLYHGDDIKSWSGIPFYGINRAVGQFTQLQQMQEARFDYLHIGHFHQDAKLPKYRGEVFINGTGMGTDEYAFVALRAAGPPKQRFMGCHQRYGITWRLPINLEFATTEIEKPRYVGHLKGDLVNQLEAMNL